MPDATLQDIRTDLAALLAKVDLMLAPPPPPPATTFPGAATANRMTWDGKLFGSTSPWNTPIPANTLIDPNSAKMTGPGSRWHRDFHGPVDGITTQAHTIDINTHTYGVPFYYADASTPRVTLYARYSWSKAGGIAVGGVVTNVFPLPPEYVPDRGGDKHLSVWDVAADLLYECWELRLENGRWIVGSYTVFPAAGGIGYQTPKWANGPRAYGGSLIAGAIRYGELVAGKIEHALALSHPHTPNAYARGVGPGGVMAIASHSDNNNYAPAGELCVPEGARLRLKASVDVEARAPTPAAKIIGRALKTYGCYCVDHAGVHVLYAENLEGHTGVSWTGKLVTGDARWIKADDFEVCAMPALTNPG